MLGGNYGWAIKEGTSVQPHAPARSARRRESSPGVPAGLIDPISGTMGTLQYDHGDGISITGGFVYRGTAIPELFGKYVFGDLAIRNQQASAASTAGCSTPTWRPGVINEFLIPQFANDQLPNRLTVHGFGEDGDGELYAMVTNTPANGAGPNGPGGIMYKFCPCRNRRRMLLAFAVGSMFLRTRRRN